jgi:hypothetical protein
MTSELIKGSTVRKQKSSETPPIESSGSNTHEAEPEDSDSEDESIIVKPGEDKGTNQATTTTASTLSKPPK